MKEIRAHIGLLAIGAVAILAYLLRQKPTSVAPVGVSVSAPTVASPSYPNAAPIKMGDINVGGSPINLTYNTYTGTPPDPIQTFNPADECGGYAGQPVSVQKVSDTTFKNAQENLQGYHAKSNVAVPFHPAIAATRG